MSNDGSNGPKPRRPDGRVRDHLANERTYLAWVRTGLGLIGVGFVLARVGMVVSRVATTAGPRSRGDLEFLAIGVGFLVLGTALFVGSAWLYERARAAIDQDRYEPPRHAVRWLTVALVMGSLALIGLVLRQVVSPEGR